MLQTQLEQTHYHSFPMFLVSWFGILCDSKPTMNHLFPSSSFRGGFFVRMLSGFGFFPGAGLLPRRDDKLLWLSLRCGTVAPARNDGFL
jgi:hypothetical protein